MGNTFDRTETAEILYPDEAKRNDARGWMVRHLYHVNKDGKSKKEVQYYLCETAYSAEMLIEALTGES